MLVSSISLLRGNLDHAIIKNTKGLSDNLESPEKQFFKIVESFAEAPKDVRASKSMGISSSQNNTR